MQSLFNSFLPFIFAASTPFYDTIISIFHPAIWLLPWIHCRLCYLPKIFTYLLDHPYTNVPRLIQAIGDIDRNMEEQITRQESGGPDNFSNLNPPVSNAQLFSLLSELGLIFDYCLIIEQSPKPKITINFMFIWFMHLVFSSTYHAIAPILRREFSLFPSFLEHLNLPS